MRPLYRDLKAPGQRPPEGHPGLWFERFFDGFDDQWKVKSDDAGKNDPKRKWIETVTGRIGTAKELEQATNRLISLTGCLGGRTRAFTTDWHFATGLGLPHPVENGFAWHPTLGTPYLCGAAVKGLIRAYLEQYAGLEGVALKDKVRDWFGDTTQAGGLLFFDTLPVRPPELAVDVMTPHGGKWYEQGGEIDNPAREPQRVPADWHDPMPVPFLVVREATFLFAIAPRCPKDEGKVAEALELLEAALDWLGAGAKTAVGYGRMVPDQGFNAKLDDARQQAQLETLSKEEQQLLQLREEFRKAREANLREAGGTLNRLTGQLLGEARQWPEPARLKLADLAEQVYEYLGWSKKMKKEKKPLIEQLRQSREDKP